MIKTCSVMLLHAIAVSFKLGNEYKNYFENYEISTQRSMISLDYLPKVLK